MRLITFFATPAPPHHRTREHETFTPLLSNFEMF
jgi:hypothetical protein